MFDFYGQEERDCLRNGFVSIEVKTEKTSMSVVIVQVEGLFTL